MQEIEARISELFKGAKIVKLKELVVKAAIISKVRVGNENNRTSRFYQEISLTDIDEYGIIHPPKPLRELEKANEKVLYKQALQVGDLVLYHRAKSLSVGLFDGRYTRYPIVGNNSMIRIQFDESRKINTPIYVQYYLQLPFIKEYLYSLTLSEDSDQKKILSSAQLLELPIPYFEESANPYTLMKFFYKRIDICTQIKLLQEQVERIHEQCALMPQETLRSYQTPEEMQKYLQDDEKMLEHLKKISEDLGECERLFR